MPNRDEESGRLPDELVGVETVARVGDGVGVEAGGAGVADVLECMAPDEALCF